MKQYLDLLRKVRTEGVQREDRTGTGTLSIFGYQMPLEVRDIRTAYHYFQSHDIEEVERLISTYIAGLGKKISQGYGIISGFKIEKLNYNPFEGKVLRPIPCTKPSDLEENNEVKYMSWKPPYWSSDSFGFCRTK